MITPATSYVREASVNVRNQTITFRSRLAESCRQMRDTDHFRPLTKSDRKLLSEVGDGRGLVRFEQLADISANCRDAGSAVSLSEAFRGHALAPRIAEPLTVLEAMRIEARADGAEDAAVVEYLANPCDANRQRAIEALRRAAETTLAVVDALHRARAS